MNRREDIVKELQDAAPILAAYKATESLPAVPENYFAGLEDSTMAFVVAEGGQWTATSAVQVPERYFEQLEDAVMANIKAQEKAGTSGKTVRLSIGYTLFARIAAAAVLAGILVLTIFSDRTALPVSDCQDGIACLTQEEIYNYMQQNSHEFGVEQIQETVTPALEQTTTAIATEEIQDYLEQEQLYLELDDASTDIF